MEIGKNKFWIWHTCLRNAEQPARLGKAQAETHRCDQQNQALVQVHSRSRRHRQHPEVWSSIEERAVGKLVEPVLSFSLQTYSRSFKGPERTPPTEDLPSSHIQKQNQFHTQHKSHRKFGWCVEIQLDDFPRK